MRCGGALREYWLPRCWSIRDAQAKARDLKREPGRSLWGERNCLTHEKLGASWGATRLAHVLGLAPDSAAAPHLTVYAQLGRAAMEPKSQPTCRFR